MSDTTGIALAIIIPVCIIGGCIAVLWYRRQRQRQRQGLASKVTHNQNVEVEKTYNNHENDHGFTGVPIYIDQNEHYAVDPLNSDQMQHIGDDNQSNDNSIVEQIQVYMVAVNNYDQRHITWNDAVREYMQVYHPNVDYQMYISAP